MVKKFSVIMTKQAKNNLVIAQKNRSMTEKKTLLETSASIKKFVTILFNLKSWIRIPSL